MQEKVIELEKPIAIDENLGGKTVISYPDLVLRLKKYSSEKVIVVAPDLMSIMHNDAEEKKAEEEVKIVPEPAAATAATPQQIQPQDTHHELPFAFCSK